TEHTAQTPPDLAEASAYLRRLPGRNVLVLPSMYADFVAYNADKGVVWGGHSGDLRRFDEFYPVIRRPISYFVERYDVDYLLLDHAYTTPERLAIGDCVTSLERFGAICVYEFVQVDAATPTPHLTSDPRWRYLAPEAARPGRSATAVWPTRSAPRAEPARTTAASVASPSAAKTTTTRPRGGSAPPRTSSVFRASRASRR